MYNVTLVNLSPDARSVATLAHVELRGVDAASLQGLLRNFCELDPIENAVADTEIRVQIRHENYLLRTENRKLILYDVHRRELPAQILTVGEALREMDGTASAARNQTILQARADAAPGDAPGTELPVRPPPPAANPRRSIILTVTAALLLAGNIWLIAPFTAGGTPPGFTPITAPERARLDAALTGVYLTGSEPGQHGIVIIGPGEMKLFELGAVEAPRVVYAGYRPGRINGNICLATDQPGGVIEVKADGNLAYGGEVYQRIP